MLTLRRASAVRSNTPFLSDSPARVVRRGAVLDAADELAAKRISVERHGLFRWVN